MSVDLDDTSHPTSFRGDTPGSEVIKLGATLRLLVGVVRLQFACFQQYERKNRLDSRCCAGHDDPAAFGPRVIHYHRNDLSVFIRDANPIAIVEDSLARRQVFVSYLIRIILSDHCCTPILK